MKMKKVVMVVEVNAFGIHRCCANVIGKINKDESGLFLKSKIVRHPTIRAYNWAGYTPCKDSLPNLQQEKSDKGKSFAPVHRQIMVFMVWLRRIKHDCAKLPRYLDNFCYRFNRLKYPKNSSINLSQICSGMSH